MNKSILSLYVITCENEHHDFEKRVISAIKGGATCIQLREKKSQGLRMNVAKKLRRITREFNVPLIINDDLQTAIEVDADGIHLGQHDLNWHEAREQLGKEKLIGLSIENKEQALANQHAAVDYFGVGPIFSTRSKKNAAPAIGCSVLNDITNILKNKPVVAIGGVTLENLAEVLVCSVAGIAVISGIMKADNPYEAALAYKKRGLHEIL